MNVGLYCSKLANWQSRNILAGMNRGMFHRNYILQQASTIACMKPGVEKEEGGIEKARLTARYRQVG